MKKNASTDRTSPRFLGLNEFARLLAGKVGRRRDTFPIARGFVECELGGTFTPSCGEMQTFSSRVFDNKGGYYACAINSVVKMKAGDQMEYNNHAARCFYEFIRKGTSVNFMRLRIKAQGILEISVVAQGNAVDKVVQQSVVDFGGEASVRDLPEFDAASLPANASLLVRARCLGPEGMIYGFRWIGSVPESRANLGERIFLIRTFGCKTAVVNSLRTIAERLAADHVAVLKRTLFIVYDATGDSGELRAGEIAGGLRILEVKGPNFGGGGNASLLVSALLRLDEAAAGAVSELVIMDDDARIDAETIVRHDAFVTARKENVLSTAVVYQSNAPYTIQEFGGFWGRFFSGKNNRNKVSSETGSRLFFPYLIRSSRDMAKLFDCKYVAAWQPAEFATFIFISFPYAFIRSVGAPFPFFLRNDDVEICLRSLERGGQLVVNPNIHAWHETAHNPVSEFYSVLHGLVVNNAYGGLSKEYVCSMFMERVGRIAKVGNCILLYAYMLALEKFSQGPDWMRPESIFDVYKECYGAIRKMTAETATPVPFEVVDVNRKDVQIVNLVEICPKTPTREEIVFLDTGTTTYYSIDGRKAALSAEQMLERCLSSLNVIAKDFDALCERWKTFVRDFDHVAFWDGIFERERLELQFERAAFPQNFRAEQHPELLQVHQVGQEKIQQEATLPAGFTEEGYLANNPDVASSGMNPSQHWLKYGRFEGRKFN